MVIHLSESQITKNALAESLIQICQHKKFEKISIADMTKECGLNRQTFYYHFTDKYDLLEWIYQNQAFRFLVEETTLENWDQHILEMLAEMRKNSNFYRNTVSAYPQVLTRSFSKITQTLFQELFVRIDTENRISQSDRNFYCRFFSYGCSGVLTEWILNGFKDSPDVIAQQFFRFAKDTELLASSLYKKAEN